MPFPMFPGHSRSPRQSHRAPMPAIATITHQEPVQLTHGMHPAGQAGAAAGSRPNQTEPESTLRQLALTHAQQGKYAEAIALLNQLIAGNPSNASDFNNRGLLHFQGGNTEAALADYNRAIQINPRLAKIYNNRANCYASLGQLAEAIADYETAIDLDPTNINALINQGITFRDLEMYSHALENLDLALRLSEILTHTDSRNHSHDMAGHIYAERGRTHHLAGDWNCAIADYQRALLELPNAPAARRQASSRLYLQVESWMDELFQPLMIADTDEEL